MFSADDLQQPARRRAQKAAASRHGYDVVARYEVLDANRSDRRGPEFFGDVALRKQCDAKAGFDQTFLGRQAVDRRPLDFTQSVGLEEREYMRRGDLAAAGQFGES